MQLSLQVNPKNVQASWDQIRNKRDEIRISPITLNDGRTFDSDEDSFRLFYDSIDEFEHLPSEGLDENGKLPWKMSNNLYTPCTKADLQAIVAELKTKRAVRAAVLQVRAEVLKVTGCTVGDLEELTTWFPPTN